MDRDRDELIGASLGSYRVTSKLGQGGMGAVYLAEHPVLGRKAAIKVLLPELSRQKDSVERFFHEARTTAQLRHPAMVDVFDFGTLPDGRAFLIMDYLEGEPLDARIRDRGALPAPDALRLARQIALGVSVAHAEQIVHRDLKPDNVFLLPPLAGSSDERVKILDFGIAKLNGNRRSDSMAVTREGMVIGTPTYMSPEQCRGDHEVDHRADIYSLGCILYTMLTGRPPFESDSLLELIWLHQNQQPTPLAALVEISEEVDALVTTMMAKAPGERFSSMLAVANAIKGLLEGESTAEMPRQPTPAPPAGGMPSTRAQIGNSRTTPAFPVTRTPTPADGGRASRGLVFGGGAALVVAALGIVLVGRARQNNIVTTTGTPDRPPAVERAAGPASAGPPPVAPAPAVVPAPALNPALTGEPAGAPVETPARTAGNTPPGKTGAARTGRRARATAAVDKANKAGKGDKAEKAGPAATGEAPAADPTPRPPGKPIYKGTQLEIEKKVPY